MKKIDLKQYAKLLYEIGEEAKDTKKAISAFVKILDNKRILYKIDELISEYEKYYNKEKNIVKAKITTANKLTEKSISKLREKIKNIEIEEEINQDVLGGARIEIEGKIIDGSVRGRLNRLNLHIKKS